MALTNAMPYSDNSSRRPTRHDNNRGDGKFGSQCRQALSFREPTFKIIVDPS